MKIQSANGDGLIILQPSKSESINFESSECSPFNGSGCNLKLKENATLRVKLLDDDDFITTDFVQGWNPELVGVIHESEGYTSIDFAGQ